MNTGRAVLSRDDILEAADRIEPLPASIVRLLELSSDPDAGLREIAEVIRYDPVLSVDILRRANSASSSALAGITDVTDAVTRLGTSEVLILAMKRAMQGRMSEAIPAYGLDANALWQHSLAATVAAETIAHRSSMRIPAFASTAALLHDVGKLVIADCLAPSVLEFIMATSVSTGRALFEVEREILGADHAEISGAVLRGWGMPMSVQIAVTRHHDISENADMFSHAVAAASAVAHTLPGVNSQEPVPLDARATRSLQHCGIPPRQLPAFMEEVATRLEEVRANYST